jgi:hypothetical protein
LRGIALREAACYSTTDVSIRGRPQVFSLANAEFDYEPYPICYAPDVFSASDYAALTAAYPDVSLFAHMPKLGDKYSLSERNNPAEYRKFIASQPLWAKLHAHLKSQAFIDETLAFLGRHHIDLGLGAYRFTNVAGAKRSGLMSRLTGRPELSARFEFSMMGGQGGHILPHTDDHRKLITLVFSMNRMGEWDDAWGGGTQTCLPKDRTRVYNQVNKYMDFAEVDVLKSFDFEPNQCILFIKTYNSWHQVAPINAPPGAPLRKTLTVNIERLA